MTEKAIIVKIDDEKIYASYCSSEKCSACSSECEKKKTIFEVENPNHKLLKAGMSVLISASKRNQVIQGLLALFVPFLCSIIGYVSSPYIMTFFGKRISSDAKAVFVLLFLFVSSFAVFVITRKYPIPGRPEIIDVA